MPHEKIGELAGRLRVTRQGQGRQGLLGTGHQFQGLRLLQERQPAQLIGLKIELLGLVEYVKLDQYHQLFRFQEQRQRIVDIFIDGIDAINFVIIIIIVVVVERQFDDETKEERLIGRTDATFVGNAHTSPS